MSDSIYQHFRKEESEFIDQVSGWVQQVEDEYSPYLSGFLDPRQLFIVETVVGSSGDLKMRADGGYQAAERCRVLIFPEYYEVQAEDFELELIEVKYPKKFATLSHGKILGTLMGTGIKREYFGDIMTDGETWQFFVTKGMTDFVKLQVDKIGRVTVHLESKMYTQLIVPKDEWSVETTTVSSLRLDALISAVYNISRQRSKELIDGEKVKLNWSEVQKADFEVGLLDIISIRGLGRIQLRKIEGKTRKDKHRIEIGVLRK